MDEFAGAGELTGAVGAEDSPFDGVPRAEGALVEDGRQIGCVIDVEVREQDDVHLVEGKVELADFDERVSARIDEDSRCTVKEDDVAAIG